MKTFTMVLLKKIEVTLGDVFTGMGKGGAFWDAGKVLCLDQDGGYIVRLHT